MKTTWGVSFQIQWRAAAVVAADSTRGCLDQPLYYQKSSVEAALKTKGFYQLAFFFFGRHLPRAEPETEPEEADWFC